MAKRIITRTIIACIIALVILAVQAVRAGTWFDNRTLTVWVFDVGQGDAIFIDGPNEQMLLDGGPGDAVLEKLAAVLPPWDRSIDAVIATHPHADHVEGLNAVLATYDVATLYANGELYDEPPAIAFAAHEGVHILSQGDVVDLGGGATLTVLWPPVPLTGMVSDDPNDGSIVARLSYGTGSMLLMGDTGVAQEEQMIANGVLTTADVIKVGHHGSDTSTGVSFLNVVHPDAAIISVGVHNDYGHPSALVLDRLARIGASVFRTDMDGDVRVRFSGATPTVATFSL